MPVRSLESLREAPARAKARSESPLVWDLSVRIFHWSLVAAVSVALVTGLVLPRNWIALHLAGGTLAIALVAARVAWGFLGPTYARFSAFVRAPREVLHHLRESADGHARRHRGHNPLGGIMIVGLMATVAALAVTGTIALGGALKSGPLAFVTTNAAGEAFGAIHEVLANVLLVLIGLHVAGAIYESLRSRENLVAAMIDGRKEARPGDVVPPPAQARPARAVSTVVVLLAVTAAGVVLMSGRPGLGVARGALDPAYASACGDCHVAYHPSLLPAPTWEAMFDGLARHFGENATLEEDEARQIREIGRAHV